MDAIRANEKGCRLRRPVREFSRHTLLSSIYPPRELLAKHNWQIVLLQHRENFGNENMAVYPKTLETVHLFASELLGLNDFPRMVSIFEILEVVNFGSNPFVNS